MPRMPGAEWRPLPVNHTKGGNRPRVQITHIIVGTLMGADSWFRNPDARVSSHFGVGRDGRVLQWVDTADTAWANRSANSYSVSVENEGTTGDALTAAQLQANARILEWAGRTHSIALRVNDSVSGSGLSYHSMDPSWGVTACPGSRIIAQRAEIVRRAQALRGGSPTPPEDDMPRRTLYGTTDYERRVPPGQWTSLNFNRRHDGSRWTEKEAEPSFVFRIDLPVPDADERPRRGLPRRAVAGLVGMVLLVLGLGAGVWYVNSGQFLPTPGVLGVPQEEAEATLREEGLRVKIEEEHSDTVDRGHVIATDPARGERIRRNGTVTLTVSQGPRMVEVPDLAGVPLEQAREQLSLAGLTPREVFREFHHTVEAGSVITTDPAPGTQRRPDSAVDLVVSRGEEIVVPDLTGVPEGTAVQRLTEAGFDVEVTPQRVHSAEPEGTVAGQSPEPGESAGAGDTVTLSVSKGPEMIEVPDVRGMDEDAARRTLEEAGFEVKVNRLFLTGTVFNQSVHSGDRAERGSVITIWVR